MRTSKLSLLVSSVALLLIGMQPARAEDSGYLLIHAHPSQAYIYADGVPYVESKRHFIKLTAGEHKIDIYNYGFRPEERTVTIAPKKLWVMEVTMQAIPGMVSGPWGAITIKGADRAAVLLNGKDPSEFFVGHGDEFNNEAIWHQELIVPPGRQELTLQYAHREPWTTTVDVQPNKRVVVDAYKGVRETVNWSRGEQLSELPRFHAGIASAQVVVEKVAASFNASAGQIDCGGSANLAWTSNGAAKVELNGQPVDASGNQTVNPTDATTYHFVAVGPGGTYTNDATVNVNKDINASLSVTPTDVSYQNNGSNPNTATLTWSAPNATNVTIDGVGTVADSGTQQVPVNPSSSSTGPIDQTVTYTLHATNACGGSETRTASLHLTGNNGEQTATAAPTEPPAPSETTEIAQAQAPAQLPKTASELPLVGLLGGLFLAAAATLRVFLKISA